MTQRDDGHDYRDSKNKAQAYERKKKEKEKLDYCIAHADYLYDKLMRMIVDDFKNQKNNLIVPEEYEILDIQPSATQEMIDDNTIGIGELDK